MAVWKETVVRREDSTLRTAVLKAWCSDSVGEVKDSGGEEGGEKASDAAPADDREGLNRGEEGSRR